MPLGCLHQIDQLKVQSARNSVFYFLVVNHSEVEVERILLVNRGLTGLERLLSSVYGKMVLVAQIHLHHPQSVENHPPQVLWNKGKIT